MKTFFFTLVLVLVLCVFSTHAANLFSRADGTWSNTNGGANCSCTPTQNDIITVNHNITITGDFTLNTGTLIVNAGTLTINGSLTFNNGSIVDIDENGGLTITGDFTNKNNSDDVTFDGDIYVGGNFSNGAGAGTGAIIDFGPNATITIVGSCSNPGTVNDGSGAYSGCGQGLLPVTITSFKGETTTEGILLRWVTSMEEDFDKFIVQQSVNGVEFNNIGEVRGQQRNLYNLESVYTFADQFPTTGINYYRLQAVDLDGTYDYTKVIAVVGNNEQKKFTVFPNPADQGRLEFRFNFVPEVGDKIIVTDAVGRELLLVSGKTLEASSLNSTLNPGAYILIYKGSQFTSTSRFIVK